MAGTRSEKSRLRWLWSPFVRYHESCNPYTAGELLGELLIEMASFLPVLAIVVMGCAQDVSAGELWRFSQLSAGMTALVYCITSCVRVFRRTHSVELAINKMRVAGILLSVQEEAILSERRISHGYVCLTAASTLLYLYPASIFIRLMKGETPEALGTKLNWVTAMIGFIVVTSLFKMVGSIGYSARVASALSNQPQPPNRGT